MQEVSTTKLSSRGQVVIPEEIRDRLGLEAGVRFVVLGEGDIVILKAIHAPVLGDFDELIAEARTAARRVGLRRSDIRNAVAEARGGM